MLALVALVVVQESVVDCPALMVDADAEKPSMTARGLTVIVTSRVSLPATFATVRRYVRVVGGVTAIEPSTATGVTAPEVRSVIEAEVAPVLVHESVELEPAQIGEAEAAKLSTVGGWLTFIVMSRVSEPQEFVAVKRYVRVVAGVTASEPEPGTPVTAPVARSVMLALVAFELDHESVEAEPLQIGEVAVKD